MGILIEGLECHLLILCCSNSIIPKYLIERDAIKATKWNYHLEYNKQTVSIALLAHIAVQITREVEAGRERREMVARERWW